MLCLCYGKSELQLTGSGFLSANVVLLMSIFPLLSAVAVCLQTYLHIIQSSRCDHQMQKHTIFAVFYSYLWSLNANLNSDLLIVSSRTKTGPT